MPTCRASGNQGQEIVMKKIYTIKKKQSSSGSIHDLASDTKDRDIIFRDGCVYAVVTASFYGGKGYTTHKTQDAAISASRRLTKLGYSHEIIDSSGCSYDVYIYMLAKN